MAANDTEARAEVSRRLKAARWLMGGTDEDGKPRAVNVRELAARDPLALNGIAANRLEEIEQMRVAARPMELAAIAQGLGVPLAWFTAEDSVSVLLASVDADRARRLAAELASMLSEAAATSPDEGAPRAPAGTPPVKSRIRDESGNARPPRDRRAG